MSKRLRLENERLQQIKEDDKVEKDRLKLIKERMYAPVVWKEFSNGVQIMDLKEHYYGEVLEMIEKYFIPEDVLTRNSEMEEDEVSKKSFMDQCMFQMKDTTSLIAVNSACEPPELIGCCLNRVVNKDDFGRVFSGTIMKDGEAQEKCMKIKAALNRKVNIFELFNCDVYLKMYAVCIKPWYRHLEYGYEMMKSTFKSAKSLHMDVVMGIFSTNSMQKAAKRLGMRVMEEISYVQWRNRETGTLIFDDPGPGNYTIAIMAGLVSDIPVKKEIIPQKKKEEVVEKPVLTRQERREIAAKKKRKINLEKH